MAEPMYEDDADPAPARTRRTTALAIVSPDPPLPPPPDGAILHPPVVPGTARPWFLVQLADEIRLAVRMYFDTRYRVSKTFQFLGPAVLAMFAVNYVVFAVWLPIPIFSAVAERVVCVLLGVFLYKLLTRELARYRDVLDYMARYLR